MPKPAVRVPMPVERAYIAITIAVVLAVACWAVYASIAERIRPEVIALAAAIVTSISAIILIGLWILRRGQVSGFNVVLDRIDGREQQQERDRDWRDYADELAQQARAGGSANVTYLHPNGHRN